MRVRPLILTVFLALAILSANAQGEKLQSQFSIIDDVVCVTVLLPGNEPWYEALTLFSTAIHDLTASRDESATGHIPMDQYNRLVESGLEDLVGKAQAWGYRLEDLTEEQKAELRPDPWVWFSPKSSLVPGELLPSESQGPHIPVEMTLCAPLPEI